MEVRAPLTQTLDRIAQSHIEGRVRPVVISRPMTAHNRCYHCHAEYEPVIGYYPHTDDCPCVSRWRKE